jgi:hypothetical protein
MASAPLYNRLYAGLGEKPGWWAPEHMAPPKKKLTITTDTTPHCGARVVLGLQDFVSAMKYPPFRWYFIASAFGSVYSTSPLPPPPLLSCVAACC